MKYCPLCGAEYREGAARCANCAVPLVGSLSAAEVRSNPARLLWIGRDEQEFASIVGAFRETGIAANAAQGVGGILGALLNSESKIYVLQGDLDRALDAARNAIAARAPVSGESQTCPDCSGDCSASLAICPNCKAVLYVEPLRRTRESDGREESRRIEPKYCPLCGAGYSASHERCTVCGVELVSEAMRGRPLDDQQKRERIVMIWRGGDPLAVSEVVNRLREAGIRHHVHATEDHLVFELGMPRPKYAVRVFESDVPKATELLTGIRESLPFGLSFTPVLEAEAAPALQRSQGPWNAAAATIEVWSGEDEPVAELLEACFRENRIGVRRTGLEPGTLRLFVMSGDEEAAREIIREVREAAPPA
jgi:predicted amidophosphoribosyltransferase